MECSYGTGFSALSVSFSWILAHSFDDQLRRSPLHPRIRAADVVEAVLPMTLGGVLSQSRSSFLALVEFISL